MAKTSSQRFLPCRPHRHSNTHAVSSQVPPSLISKHQTWESLSTPFSHLPLPILVALPSKSILNPTCVHHLQPSTADPATSAQVWTLQPFSPPGTLALQVPTLGSVLSWPHLEMLHNFGTRGLAFSFCTGSLQFLQLVLPVTLQTISHMRAGALLLLYTKEHIL